VIIKNRINQSGRRETRIASTGTKGTKAMRNIKNGNGGKGEC
jgi:hypothetical protein